MPLSEFLRNYLSGEFLIAANKIGETDDLVDKAYYFSATYGALQRAFNIEYNPKLVLMHLVCLATHQAINSRLQALKEGREASVRLNSVILDDLSTVTRGLSERIRNDEDAGDLLERLSVIALSTTGNGFYLASIGRLR